MTYHVCVLHNCSAPTSGTKRRGGAGGLNKVCGVSPELQVVVGEPALPRTEVVTPKLTKILYLYLLLMSTDVAWCFYINLNACL